MLGERGERIAGAFSWGSVPADVASVRRSLQRRLSFLGFMVFILSAAMFALMFGLEQLGTVQMATWTATSLDPWHVAGSSSALLLWLSLRSGERSVRLLHAADAAFAVVVCSCWTGMGFGAHANVHVEFFVLLASVLTLAFRSALVPSTGARTFAISAVALAVVTAGSFLFHLRGDALDPLADRLAYTGMTLAWCGLAVVVTTVTSYVLYGLQRRTRKAEQLGQYELVRKIGEGGMGAVYLARHAMLRRPTAIKLLAAGRVREHHLTRFEREVQMTSKLTHPNTVDIYDYGRTPDGIFYYAMEYMDGPNLQELLERFGPVPPARVIHVLTQLCGALAEAHDTGLIHRDIKPANIILTHRRGAHDLPKLLDFGLVEVLGEDADAGVTQENAVIGTPLYLCPEMIKGNEVDGRSDLYSLGAVAYFMLTGSPVFQGKTTIAVCGQHLNEQPTPPSQRVPGIAPDLEELILKCLAKEPDERPADAIVLKEALESCQDAGKWLRHDADSWWDEHGEIVAELQRGRAETLSTGGNSIAIDLGRRSTPLPLLHPQGSVQGGEASPSHR